MKSPRILSLIVLVLLLSPSLFAAEFGVRGGRLNEAEENFVGADLLFDLGAFNLNPNVEYWLVDGGTAGTANFDVTLDFGSSNVQPYVGVGVGLLYTDPDLGASDTETIGNALAGLQFNTSFLKPYGQVKYTRSLENTSGGNHELALTVGLRF